MVRENARGESHENIFGGQTVAVAGPIPLESTCKHVRAGQERERQQETGDRRQGRSRAAGL